MRTLSRLSHVLLTALLAGGLLAAGASPVSAVSGTGIGIDREYRALPDPGAWLGDPVSAERCGLRDDGCYRQYQKGTIHWSPTTGARAQRGGILARWRAEGSEHGNLGYPVSRETWGKNGCEVRYQRGRITWTATAGAVVHRDVDAASSASVVVNKKRPLSPRRYVPSPLRAVGGGVQLRDDAATAYQRMSRAATAQSVPLVAQSGYRDYATQDSLYRGYTASYGQAIADSLSARPGYSEHQTGLAVDVATPTGACTLLACFSATPQGRWIAAHAHEYGFIVRYPQGQTPTTGYAYEPWHLRYVGTVTAKSVKKSGRANLEAYLELPAAPTY
ncbi:D-alanyl-D-alanine carboxypeptidase family protein [Kocuria salsicia]|uniref:D-alanyl-D-alanine carboxypeptidase family protein n=1 Tax=Kocuria salsicia TaxID=664639 RepID=UPI0011A2EF89|nr:D-alanyl-D-alanine carboxypeptidase family protein [Kocuria salsicia]